MYAISIYTRINITCSDDKMISVWYTFISLVSENIAFIIVNVNNGKEKYFKVWIFLKVPF